MLDVHDRSHGLWSYPRACSPSPRVAARLHCWC